jgi:hypothetical protein
MGITVIIFILGSAYLCYTISLEENFFASTPQLLGTVIIIVILLIIAFKIPRPTKVPVVGFIPNLWITGGFSLTISSLFMLSDALPGWTKVGVGLLLVIIFFITIFGWSGRIGWSTMHRLAVIGGGILTYAWLGLFMEPESGPKAGSDYVGSVFLAFSVIILLAFASGKLRKFEMMSQKE